jgi:hypothetical protein
MEAKSLARAQQQLTSPDTALISSDTDRVLAQRREMLPNSIADRTVSGAKIIPINGNVNLQTEAKEIVEKLMQASKTGSDAFRQQAQALGVTTNRELINTVWLAENGSLKNSEANGRNVDRVLSKMLGSADTLETLQKNMDGSLAAPLAAKPNQIAKSITNDPAQAKMILAELQAAMKNGPKDFIYNASNHGVVTKEQLLNLVWLAQNGNFKSDRAAAAKVDKVVREMFGKSDAFDKLSADRKGNLSDFVGVKPDSIKAKTEVDAPKEKITAPTTAVTTPTTPVTPENRPKPEIKPALPVKIETKPQPAPIPATPPPKPEITPTPPVKIETKPQPAPMPATPPPVQPTAVEPQRSKENSNAKLDQKTPVVEQDTRPHADIKVLNPNAEIAKININKLSRVYPNQPLDAKHAEEGEAQEYFRELYKVPNYIDATCAIRMCVALDQAGHEIDRSGLAKAPVQVCDPETGEARTHNAAIRAKELFRKIVDYLGDPQMYAVNFSKDKQVDLSGKSGIIYYEFKNPEEGRHTQYHIGIIKNGEEITRCSPIDLGYTGKAVFIPARRQERQILATN